MINGRKKDYDFYFHKEKPVPIISETPCCGRIKSKSGIYLSYWNKNNKEHFVAKFHNELKDNPDYTIYDTCPKCGSKIQYSESNEFKHISTEKFKYTWNIEITSLKDKTKKIPYYKFKTLNRIDLDNNKKINITITQENKIIFKACMNWETPDDIYLVYLAGINETKLKIVEFERKNIEDYYKPTNEAINYIVELITQL